MVTEVYKYSFKGKPIDYGDIQPGNYGTIVNINSDGEKEIIVVHCREDNKCSYIYTIHPMAILSEANPPVALYYDDETENRADVIWENGERIINTREMNPTTKKLESFRYRLCHRK